MGKAAILYVFYCICHSVCVYALVPLLPWPDHNKRVHQLCFAKPAVGSNLQPSPAMFEVCDCMHTSQTVLVVWRAMLDQTPDCGDYYWWPHTYSCTHAGYKIFNSRLPCSLFLSCLLSTWNQFCKKQDPCLLVGQKHHQRVFPFSLLGLLVLS